MHKLFHTETKRHIRKLHAEMVKRDYAGIDREELRALRADEVEAFAMLDDWEARLALDVDHLRGCVAEYFVSRNLDDLTGHQWRIIEDAYTFAGQPVPQWQESIEWDDCARHLFNWGEEFKRLRQPFPYTYNCIIALQGAAELREENDNA